MSYYQQECCYVEPVPVVVVQPMGNCPSCHVKLFRD